MRHARWTYNLIALFMPAMSMAQAEPPKIAEVEQKTLAASYAQRVYSETATAAVQEGH